MSTSRRANAEGSLLDADIEAPANVLLLAPAMTASEDAVCCDLLDIAPLDRENLLCISFTRSPDEQLDVWRTHVGPELPANVGYVSVGDTTRSAAAPTDTGAGPSGTTRRIETVSSPSDLTGLGIKMSTMLSDWEDTGNETAICFRSLTTLLQYAGLERVFKFLHVATGRTESVGALAHFHLDPEAHEEQALNTLLSLFDVLVEYDDGDWSVRTR